jgi:hypothetical protein
VGWISPDLLKTLTAGSLLLLVVLFFMLGWIRPRSAITEIREIYDARLVEAHMQIQEWREACRLSEEARKLSDQSVSEALEVAKTSEAVIESLRAVLAYSKGSAAE